MIKYRTRFDIIEAIEVVRETKKKIVLPANSCGKEISENKVSNWTNWHETWEEAHAFLVSKAEREVESLRLQLEQAKGILGQIKGMKPNAELTGASGMAAKRPR